MKFRETFRKFATNFVAVLARSKRFDIAAVITAAVISMGMSIAVELHVPPQEMPDVPSLMSST
jgi:hypothetical protein